MEKFFEHSLHTFDSKLRLVTVPMKGTKAVTVLVLVGTGSKYESKNINGISHFLEHMMFKGTEERPHALDIAKELDAIGAEYNAFTSKEYTGYYAKASADKLDTVLDVISDIFLHSKLDGKEIEVEKGVIVEEINMYRDTPMRYIGDLFEQLLYGDQPAGWDVAGEKETVVKLTRDDFVGYFGSHYVAEDTIVAIAGNIDPSIVREKVVSAFAHARHGTKPAKPRVVEQQAAPQILVHYKATDQAHFHLGVRTYDMFDDRKYALGLMGVVLGGGMSSRLFTEVREKRGLAYYVRAGGEHYTDSGFFAVRAGVNTGKAQDAVAVVLEEIRKVKADGVTEEELQAAKDNIKGSMVLSLEHSDAVANFYADSLLFYGKILTPEEELGKIYSVTGEDVRRVATEIFDNAKLNFALIGPFKDEDPFRKILSI